MIYPINKRPQVIYDLIDLASYIAINNMSASDKFLSAAEETFRYLSQFPLVGKKCNFSHPDLINVRQIAIQGYRNYLIFYIFNNREVEIIRVFHGSRDIKLVLENDLTDNEDN